MSRKGFCVAVFFAFVLGVFAETETLKVPYHYGTAGGLQVAVRILNNIGKAESEDKYGYNTK